MSNGAGPSPAALTLDGLRYRRPRAGADTLGLERLHLQRAERVLVPQAGQVCLPGQDWRTLSAGRRDRPRAHYIGDILQQSDLLPG
ncbi:MAG: hypothetical protein JNL87_11005 [Burkholderiaceae bacterium]|nr:hypothetical protein [Burkholderiaceae bacterium]